MTRLAAAVAMTVLAAGTAGADTKVKEEKVEGYLEWRQGEILIVDGQKVATSPAMKFKGKDAATSVATIPMGFEVKAKGERNADGALVARELEAKPNGSALFEGDVRSMTDQAESEYRKAGRFFNTLEGGRTETVGWMFDSGPKADRARRIVDSLLPPYVDPSQVRVYVIENKEWNAFAMGNYSLYVFSGMMDDLDDDELAIVLGHEIAHATHEHTRRQFKKAMWIQLAALGVAAAAEEIDDKNKRAVAQLLVLFGAPGLVERVRPRHGGPGGPRRPALRVRGGLRHHEGPAPVAALREEVRRAGQGRELLLRQPLALVGSRGEPGAAAGAQLPRRRQGQRRTHGGGFVHSGGQRAPARTAAAALERPGRGADRIVQLRPGPRRGARSGAGECPRPIRRRQEGDPPRHDSERGALAARKAEGGSGVRRQEHMDLPGLLGRIRGRQGGRGEVLGSSGRSTEGDMPP